MVLVDCRQGTGERSDDHGGRDELVLGEAEGLHENPGGDFTDDDADSGGDLQRSLAIALAKVQKHRNLRKASRL